VGPVLIGQARQQLVPDLAIRLSRRLRLQGGGQGLNEVRSAHDADQLAVLDDGNALDAVLFQQRGDFRQRGLFRRRHHVRRHDPLTRSPCALANSSASMEPGVSASSHHGRCFSVPISARRTRSASLSIPTTLPPSSTTGSALMSCSIRSLIAEATSVSGLTVTTSRTITSIAFMVSSSTRSVPRRRRLSEVRTPPKGIRPPPSQNTLTNKT